MLFGWQVEDLTQATGGGAGAQGRFTVEDDDLQLVELLFAHIDTNKDGQLSKDELDMAVADLNSEGQGELAEKLMAELELAEKEQTQTYGNGGGSGDISKEAFLKAMERLPRVRGERLDWAASLGMHGELARLLKPGTISDGLRGLRELKGKDLENHVLEVCGRFAAVLPALLTEAILNLQDAVSKNHSVVQQHINSKFVMDGAFVGNFATLNDFHIGPEGLIGVPNPKTFVGMELEHCLRPNATRQFVTSSYNVSTHPKQEWEFVVCPAKKDGGEAWKDYPHTPRDKALWPSNSYWKADSPWIGDHGRDVIPLEVLIQAPEVAAQVQKADLRREEVIAPRLYSGPMFVLYNAALRGFPERDLKLLRANDDDLVVNKYETTIFVIASSITKLSKVAGIPAGRKLWRGLGGMVLPDHFWKEFEETQVRIAVTCSSVELASKAAEALANSVKASQQQVMTSTKQLETKILVVDGLPEVAQEARVVSNAIVDGCVVRMTLALAISKFSFTQEMRDSFSISLAKLARVGDGQVNLLDVADKPSDFKGGGEQRTKLCRESQASTHGSFPSSAGKFAALLAAKRRGGEGPAMHCSCVARCCAAADPCQRRRMRDVGSGIRAFLPCTSSHGLARA
jgi:hypothetical protein